MKQNIGKKITALCTIFILLSIICIPTSISLDTSYHQNIPPTTHRFADGTTTKWAIIIACSGGVTYERHERRDRNDVKALTQQLQKNGWDQDHIFTLLEEQATTEAILIDTFQWLHNNGEDEDDLILFFYSGHGYYHTIDQPPIDEPDGLDEVIYPWDPDMAGWNWDVIITDDVLAEKFNTLNSQNIAIIMHTCHAGGFIDGEQDLRASGRVVLVACELDEASCMMLFPVHWLFPYYLIQGLKGRADQNHDKTITAEELLQYTKRPVQFRSQIYNWLYTGYLITQHPQLYDGWPNAQNNQEELILINRTN